jgi:NTP pyrophosphatase (non-canonical NTP hydrolase)
MKELIQKIKAFRDERNWKQFHNIKDLLIGLNIEVGELQELFLWNENESEFENIEDIEQEIADIFIFLIFICDKLNVDLQSTVEKKLEIHKEHYPKKLSKGKTIKYTDLNKNNETNI